MKCLLCGTQFYIKRGLLELFNTKKEFICNPCYKKYPIELGYEKILLEDYECIVISMFKKWHHINYNAFINEYSKIFASYMQKTNYHVIFMDYLSINDYKLEMLDCISKLVESDILIVTFFSKN